MYRGRHRSPQNWLERQQHQRQQRHAARMARDETMCQLSNAGMTVAAIARRLHINRLKLLKRQGYGRAHVALLRQRLVQDSASTMLIA